MKYGSLLLSLLILLGVSASWVAAISLEFRRTPQSLVSLTRRSLLPVSLGVHPRGTSGEGSGNNKITNGRDLHVRIIAFVRLSKLPDCRMEASITVYDQHHLGWQRYYSLVPSTFL